jgi:NAD(P)-dependent dehydrogenase (short-subunit alcohol dehydrogenase family)
MNFRSKVVLVTGAGIGIGLAAALKFAGLGARVALIDASVRNGEDAQKTFEQNGFESILCIADVQDSNQIKGAIERIEQKWGRLDVLVNNAGIYVQGSVNETNEEDWEHLLKINLTGAFLFTKYVFPLMVKHEGGVIVNVASEAGLVGIKDQVAYNVSKAGVISLTKSCAVDLAPYGIRVNSVCPGTTDTPLLQASINRSADPAAARRNLEQVRPLNRLGKPEEIASAIVYLASDEIGYATGSIFSIDGGYTAQ